MTAKTKFPVVESTLKIVDLCFLSVIREFYGACGQIIVRTVFYSHIYLIYGLSGVDAHTLGNS